MGEMHGMKCGVWMKSLVVIPLGLSVTQYPTERNKCGHFMNEIYLILQRHRCGKSMH